MWRILFEEFVGDLKQQKTRAMLTMFAMTWGTIAVVLLLSFGEGATQGSEGTQRSQSESGRKQLWSKRGPGKSQSAPKSPNAKVT